MGKKLFKHIRENTFEAGPSGASGAISYATNWQTPNYAGGIQAGPNHFESEDNYDVSHRGNNDDNYTGSINKKTPNDSFEPPEKPNTYPFDNFEKKKSETPLNPDNSYSKDVDNLFKKKKTPTPDEIMMGVQFELGQMVKKDKAIAKRTVLNNLKENPQYYSKLMNLNIDDKEMKVDESTFEKTKKLLDQMISERRNNRQVEQLKSPELDSIFNELKEKRMKGRI